MDTRLLMEKRRSLFLSTPLVLPPDIVALGLQSASVSSAVHKLNSICYSFVLANSKHLVSLILFLGTLSIRIRENLETNMLIGQRHFRPLFCNFVVGPSHLPLPLL
jgi:hypothetical protein